MVDRSEEKNKHFYFSFIEHHHDVSVKFFGFLCDFMAVLLIPHPGHNKTQDINKEDKDHSPQSVLHKHHQAS